MDHDSSDTPKDARKDIPEDTPEVSVPRPARGTRPASANAYLPPQDSALQDIDPATSGAEEDDEARLPEVPDESGEALPEGRLASGHAAIEHAVRHAPTSPGVYRMLNTASDVLYVGKAKNVRKRLSSYARVSAPQPARILRMIAAPRPSRSCPPRPKPRRCCWKPI